MHHTVIGDIHNDNTKFETVLKKIYVSSDDHIYLLGDLFDRCEARPDPIGVYNNVLRLGDKVTVIAGNHDLWLSQYIDGYLATPERKRERLRPYHYNTFSIMRARLTDVDLKNLSEFIKTCPLQVELPINGKKYLLSHAMTSPTIKDFTFHTMGFNDNNKFFLDGIQNYISVIGHHYRVNMTQYGGSYLDKHNPSIWINNRNNVMMIDCGSGFSYGRLGAICLETGEYYYA